MDKVRGCGSEYLSHLEGLFVSMDNGQGGGVGIDVAHPAVAGEIPGVGDGQVRREEWIAESWREWPLWKVGKGLERKMS